MVRVGWFVDLHMDHQFAIGRVQLAALEHVAVQRITVDRVVDEKTVLVVKRQLPELRHRRQVVQVKGNGVAVLAVEWFACGVVEDSSRRVRANGHRSEHGDVTGQCAAQPVGVVVAHVSGQRPTVHWLARTFGQLILDCPDGVLDAIGHGGLQCRGQAGRLKCLASL
ncbi:hypothetical protein D3C80_1575950 [compost metagenome]